MTCLLIYYQSTDQTHRKIRSRGKFSAQTLSIIEIRHKLLPNFRYNINRQLSIGSACQWHSTINRKSSDLFSTPRRTHVYKLILIIPYIPRLPVRWWSDPVVIDRWILSCRQISARHSISTPHRRRFGPNTRPTILNSTHEMCPLKRHSSRSRSTTLWRSAAFPQYDVMVTHTSRSLGVS